MICASVRGLCSLTVSALKNVKQECECNNETQAVSIHSGTFGLVYLFSVDNVDISVNSPTRGIRHKVLRTVMSVAPVYSGFNANMKRVIVRMNKLINKSYQSPTLC